MAYTELPDISTLEDKLLESVLICLFTDKYVSDTELDYEMGSNGGWHGDSIALDDDTTITADYSWGSRLWTLARAKTNEATPASVQEMIEEALEPLLLLENITKIEVEVEQISEGVSFSLLIYENGSATTYSFENIGA